jgi:hypothetical protein
MNNTNNEDRVLGGQIVEHLRETRAARDSREPLPVPDAMTNPAAKPGEKLAAEEVYASQLLNRGIPLTTDEQKWLGNRITACLREMRSSGERR